MMQGIRRRLASEAEHHKDLVGREKRSRQNESHCGAGHGEENARPAPPSQAGRAQTPEQAPGDDLRKSKPQQGP